MKIIFALIVTTLTGALLAAAPFNDAFSSGEPADYLHAGFAADQIRIATAKGTSTMVIANTTARFIDAPIKPTTKYTLSYVAAFSGEAESIEDNPRFEIFTRLGQTSPLLPSRTLQFIDAAGKPVGTSLQVGMPFRESHAYTHVFHTGTGYHTARSRFLPDKTFNCRSGN